MYICMYIHVCMYVCIYRTAEGTHISPAVVSFRNYFRIFVVLIALFRSGLCTHTYVCMWQAKYGISPVHSITNTLLWRDEMAKSTTIIQTYTYIHIYTFIVTLWKEMPFSCTTTITRSRSHLCRKNARVRQRLVHIWQDKRALSQSLLLAFLRETDV